MQSQNTSNVSNTSKELANAKLSQGKNGFGKFLNNRGAENKDSKNEKFKET